MSTTLTVLCPTDFSDAGRGALRYARAIAEHFGGRLIVLTVEDPLLTQAIDLGTGIVWDPDVTRRELADFSAKVFGSRPQRGIDLVFAVAVGKPAEEILRTARKERCDLIVMSTHGLTGARKFFFGSTTERVLRETTMPVLATPATDEGPDDLDRARQIVRRILVPVDLGSSSSRQVVVASSLAQTLDVPLLLTHVIEPLRGPLAAKLLVPSVEVERRARAEQLLQELVRTIPQQLHTEALVVYGDPAEETTKVSRDRQAGLIVVGLHGSPMLGPRMGSVTYRVLCLTSALVLALPPAPASPRS